MARKQADERSRYVDMWALPGIHPSNIELLQKLKTADTNHFTKNMDVIGMVSEKDAASGKWETTHMIGVRNDIWKFNRREKESSVKVLQAKRKAELKREIKRSGRLNEKQSQLLEQRLAGDALMQMDGNEMEKRRLVLKLFKTTSQRARWCGTIEEVTITEIHNSIGSQKPLVTLAVMLPQSKLVTDIQQNHKTFRIPATFTFGYYSAGRLWNLRLKRHWISLGIDYSIEADGKNIGEVDGKLISLGTDSYLRLQAHELASDTAFCDLLTLFTASVGYHRAIRRNIARRVQAIFAGESHRLVFDDDELRLRDNGRSAA